jgi:hypothetical protein
MLWVKNHSLDEVSLVFPSEKHCGVACPQEVHDRKTRLGTLWGHDRWYQSLFVEYFNEGLVSPSPLS